MKTIFVQFLYPIRENIIKGYFGYNFAYISRYRTFANRTISEFFVGNFPKG